MQWKALPSSPNYFAKDKHARDALNMTGEAREKAVEFFRRQVPSTGRRSPNYHTHTERWIERQVQTGLITEPALTLHECALPEAGAIELADLPHVHEE